MKNYPLKDEQWRMYTWTDPITGHPAEHKIDNPQILYYESGHTTHRVVDISGVVHCIPAVGYFGCVLNWKTKESNKPVLF